MKPDRSEGEEQIEFDCPECGAHIVGEVTKCPKCGVEFVIEEVLEVECPNCGAVVSADLETCPKCNARLQSTEEASVLEGEGAEAPLMAAKERGDELRRQFPALVEEVKSLLSIASEFNIDASAAKIFIDKAVRAGKQRNIESAVAFVRESLEKAREAIEERILTDIERLERLAEITQKTGSDPKEIFQSLESIRVKKAQDDLRGALMEIRIGMDTARRITGRYVEASELCESLEKLIRDSEHLYIDVREARRLLNEAKDARKHGDWTMMGVLAKKGRETILKLLPDTLKDELKKCKEVLLEAKAEGKEVTSLIKILKEAAVAFKKRNLEEALERLIEFKAELKRIS